MAVALSGPFSSACLSESPFEARLIDLDSKLASIDEFKCLVPRALGLTYVKFSFGLKVQFKSSFVTTLLYILSNLSIRFFSFCDKVS